MFRERSRVPGHTGISSSLVTGQPGQEPDGTTDRFDRRNLHHDAESIDDDPCEVGGT